MGNQRARREVSTHHHTVWMFVLQAIGVDTPESHTNERNGTSKLKGPQCWNSYPWNEEDMHQIANSAGLLDAGTQLTRPLFHSDDVWVALDQISSPDIV